MKHHLTGVPETLLIALWARAAETRSSNPFIRDEKAVEMVSQIDYDFSKFQKSKLTQVGVAVRTMLLDKALSRFITAAPDAVIVNMGAGLDTRHSRLKVWGGDWYEIDLPESIALRRKFFKESEQYQFIEQSIFDLSWTKKVKAGERPVIFLAEGLFMYFEEKELRPFFCRLAEGFPGAHMLFEVLPPFLVGKGRKHETVGKMDSRAEFKWGLKKAKDLEAWHPGIQVIDQWNYYDYCKRRWGLFGLAARLPFIRPHLSCRIVHLCFGGQCVSAQTPGAG